jgi:hypothetical protein
MMVKHPPAHTALPLPPPPPLPLPPYTPPPLSLTPLFAGGAAFGGIAAAATFRAGSGGSGGIGGLAGGSGLAGLGVDRVNVADLPDPFFLQAPMAQLRQRADEQRQAAEISARETVVAKTRARRLEGVQEALQGMAVQLDPMKPTLKAPGEKRLRMTYDKLLSKSAFKFKFNLNCAATSRVLPRGAAPATSRHRASRVSSARGADSGGVTRRRQEQRGGRHRHRHRLPHLPRTPQRHGAELRVRHH